MMKSNQEASFLSDIDKKAQMLFPNTKTKVVKDQSSNTGKICQTLTIYALLEEVEESWDYKEAQKVHQTQIDMQDTGLSLQNKIDSQFIVRNLSIEYNQMGSMVIQEGFQRTLAQVNYSQIPYTRKIDIAVDLANGLVELKNHKVLHRQITPSNIALCYYKQNAMHAKLNGFRYAVQDALSQFDIRKPPITKYSSPQTRTASLSTHESDIWSFGAIIFQLLFGDINLIQVQQEQVKILFHDNTPAWLCDFFTDILVRPPKTRTSMKNILMILRSATLCAKATQKNWPNYFEEKRPKSKTISHY